MLLLGQAMQQRVKFNLFYEAAFAKLLATIIVTAV